MVAILCQPRWRLVVAVLAMAVSFQAHAEMGPTPGLRCEQAIGAAARADHVPCRSDGGDRPGRDGAPGPGQRRMAFRGPGRSTRKAAGCSSTRRPKRSRRFGVSRRRGALDRCRLHAGQSYASSRCVRDAGGGVRSWTERAVCGALPRHAVPAQRQLDGRGRMVSLDHIGLGGRLHPAGDGDPARRKTKRAGGAGCATVAELARCGAGDES